VQVLAEDLGEAVGALVDVRVAVSRARVHWMLDAGACPRQQVDERVGVAGQMSDDVCPRPAGQPARPVDGLVIES
jgi:hypothetical protein